MSLEIILVTREDVPYWEDNEAANLGEIDPTAWECLLFKDLNIMTFAEFKEADHDPNTYANYYSDRIRCLVTKYPLVLRIKDYYQDAFFPAGDLKDLAHEIQSLGEIVNSEKSRALLNQLLSAVDAGLKTNAGIRLVAD